MLSTPRMTPSYFPLPLSPLSANIHVPRHNLFMSSSSYPSPHDEQQSQPNGHHTDQENSVAFSKRPIKKPPIPSNEYLHTQRRKTFLDTVREKREEKRFELRGDDIMRAQFLREQKDWEARLASQAPEVWGAEDEMEEGVEERREEWGREGWKGSSGMEYSMYAGSQMPGPERLVEEEVEEVVRMEEEELEALLAYLPGNEEEMEEHPWSDDDEYDALFSELMAQQTSQTRLQVGAEDIARTVQQTGGEEMDLS